MNLTSKTLNLTENLLVLLNTKLAIMIQLGSVRKQRNVKANRMSEASKLIGFNSYKSGNSTFFKKTF